MDAKGLPATADPESFVHRVRKKYDIVDKDVIQKRLNLDRERLLDERNFVRWGNPPGI